MRDEQVPPGHAGADMARLGNPAGVMTAATVGIITVLVRELVATGALQAERFLAELDDLADMPLQAPQTPDETELEQKVFALVRKAVQSAQREAV